MKDVAQSATLGYSSNSIRRSRLTFSSVVSAFKYYALVRGDLSRLKLGFGKNLSDSSIES